MFAHLLAEARSITDPTRALGWVAMHAWLEGALAALSSASADDRPAAPVSRETVQAIARQMGMSEASARRYARKAEQIAASRRAAWIAGAEVPAPDSQQ